MRWLTRLFRKRALDKQLDSELHFHVEQQIAENITAGMSPSEARRRALAQFGGLEYIKEETRDARGTHFLETLLQDIRFAVRILRKTPLITAIALLSLALGIGANTAIFSLIDTVMLRMLPVQNPQQLVQIKFRSPMSGNPRSTVTNPIWEQVRDHQDVFSGVFAWSPGSFDLAEGGEENNVHGIYASGSYFNVLGVRPAIGRLLSPSDDIRGCSGVAVLGYGFWQSHYAGADSAVGSLIRLNGHAFPIVGVSQQGFFGADVGEKLDVAIPICAEAILAGKDSSLDVRDDWWLFMMGRLKPGITVEQAGTRMKVLSQPFFGAVVPQAWPAKYQDIFRRYTFAVLPGATGTGGFIGLRQQYSQPLEILMFVVGLVLLIACANIASLLMARSAARQKEIAVRLSLGASRGRLIRQVLTESIVLSGIGAILGVLFARWGSALLVRFVSTQQNQVFLDLKMDGRVLVFTMGITVLCGLLFGILPAFRSTRVDAMSAMKEGQSQAAGGRSHSSAARWIVATQVALSLILLIGTGLFIRTFANLMTLDAGFDRNNVLMVETNIHNAGIAEPARASLYGQMLAKLQAIPGVVSASQCWMTPLSGRQWDNSLTAPGHPLPPGVEPDTLLNWVTPGYFQTMRTPLLEGRMFDARDSATSTPVVIVNQLLARRYFGSRSPIGEHLLGGSEGMLRQPMEIIGVVQDAKYTSLSEDFQPEAYFPLSQIEKNVDESSTFEIRTAMTPGALIPAVRDAMAGVNKAASLQFTTLKQAADDSVAQQHLMAVLSGFFGGLALLLTAIGLYGVMAYVVTLRTHEIGIRMALGAQQGSILRLVLRDAVIVLAAGIAAGLLGSIWITRLVQQLLFGVKPSDPWSVALAVAAIACVALVATYIPARRAMRVDPMVALRYE
ncbi:MAG TPA: ABC transporter permease [Candidatus Acidoferrales bacterium]|nr:ABC transporter permease [Candidatus Acidoferrales bacterium]